MTTSIQELQQLGLEERIAAAFADTASSEAVCQLIAEVEQAADQANETAETLRARSIDPTVGAQEARANRREMDEAAFRAERFDAALARLDTRLKELRAREKNEARWAVYRALETERDALATELKELYPDVAERLANLLARIEKHDQRREHVNGRELPSGASSLQSAEAVARGLSGFRVDGLHDVPRLTRDLRLPSFKFSPSRRYEWPPG
jgi:hypothetical protein